LSDETFDEVLTGATLTEPHARAGHAFYGIKGLSAVVDSFSDLLIGDFHASAHHDVVGFGFFWCHSCFGTAMVTIRV
jgi:hypothetical protein